MSIARAVLKANADLLGISRVRLNARTVKRSVGANHVIFTQLMDNKPIHRAYVTVHLDTAGRAYLIKNRAVPTALLPSPVGAFTIAREQARQRALKALRGSGVQLAVLDERKCWYPRGMKVLPSYRVRIHRTKLSTRGEWIVFVHAQRGTVLSKYDNLSARAIRARVFDPHPLARVEDWRVLAGPVGSSASVVRRALRPPEQAYRTVTLRDVSASGLLDGPRVSTRLTRNRVRVRDAFGTPASGAGFEEVMVYYHLSEAIRYLESLGFCGARRIFESAIAVNARGTRDDNSWYSPGLRTLTFGTGGIDDAEDGEMIVHELGHAIQDAICPDFGQSPEAAAMGEGFGDYLAASLFADKKPRALRTLVMSWDAFEVSELEPPRLRTVDEPLTYESFDHDPDADEHDNGRIWAAALWAVRGCYRRPSDADRAIIESHFQLDGFTTFARGARAILDADRNLYQGVRISRLKEVFRRRGIGPVD